MAAAAVVIAAYALLRLGEVFFRPEPDPATVVWATPVAMFWRLSVGGYLALVVAPVVWSLARRDEGAVARVVGRLVAVAAALITVQGVFFP